MKRVPIACLREKVTQNASKKGVCVHSFLMTVMIKKKGGKPINSITGPPFLK